MNPLRMSTLHKKQSAILGTKAPRVVPESPTSKSDQGAVGGGGVRLDVGFGSLTLDDSPKSSIHQQSPVRNGHDSPLFTQKRSNLDEQNDARFQIGKVSDDGDVFESPVRPNTQVSATAPLNMLGSTMQGVIPTMQPVPMLRTRASDVGNRAQVAGVDAQAFYPATACVFVANLPEYIRDARLEVELTRAFSKFGIVFVKIRRDQRNMPFAFCQYTKDEDAHNAVTQGRGILIEGRPCRTEMVKANRSFVIYNALGDDVTLDEARIHLGGFGPFSKCEALHPQIQEAMRIKGGVLVEFTNFDPSRDVISAYRHHPLYRVIAYDLKKSMQVPKIDPDEAWLQRYEIDRRSIYVGGLPVDDFDVEELLTRLAGEVGDVEKVQVVQKDGRTGRQAPIAFGFVEFARPDMADLAVKHLNGRVMRGCVLRVERKASREPQGIRHMQSRTMLSSAVNTPVRSEHIEGQKQSMANLPSEPATPSHIAVVDTSVLSSTPSSQVTQGNAYGMAPVADQNYSTPSSYGGPSYRVNPPASTETFPATPQATPGMLSPLAPYYNTPYSWMTPYLQDPNFAAMYYGGGYSPSPMGIVQGAPGADHNDDGGEDAATPTKHSSGTVQRLGVTRTRSENS
ncbi:Meiotic activator RIM4 [Daldinia childiae]|uniref:Meiotic activator RIM4 n=1 Tax=Daldinia childiae TaxID=326645 RepID=UPI00144697CA|nr:Meiotic activator RIM4 [Daldinia childiae]XP_033435059.1 Meiotic activator RIM4 [Daldinia childiae]XP_033436494.1 Meiotic activator RIM4 [Daldinia childiae]KAF3058950.1 Meiotic activator RIM4 [Daldinia childiae]KAF3058954.1 Meiotic activator RIM4 [Daldinia childiae]KAF3061345.1 Meiotic activator RIM4 [Daldinia childiae]